MLKKLIFVLCVLGVVMTVCLAQAAPKKETKQNRFQKTKTETVVEEEKSKNKKKRRIKSEISCGKTEPIRIAGFVTNPPFGWVNVTPPSGLKKAQYHNAGFAYDLFEQMAHNIGLKTANVGYTSYQDAMRDLRRGKIDVVVGAYYDRRTLGAGVNLLFPSYFTNPIMTIFLKGKERPVQSWEDLRGLKGVVRQEEMIYSLIFQQLPKDLEITQVSGSKKAFRMLLEGEADFMITGLYGAEAEVRRYKLVNDIHFEPKTLISPELFFVFSSHTDCRVYKDKLAAELKKIKADKDTYHRTLVQYIDDWGMRFKDKPSLVQEIRQERMKAALPSDIKDITSDETDVLEQEQSQPDTGHNQDTSDKTDNVLPTSVIQSDVSQEKETVDTSSQKGAQPTDKSSQLPTTQIISPKVPLSPSAQRALQF